MDANTPEFLESGFIPLLRQLDPAATGRWGKMNAQQMVEHLNDFMLVSVGKLQFPLSIPEEHLPRYREFLYSDKEFRENTKAPAAVLGEEPLPVREAGLAEAIDRLEDTMNVFFSYYRQDPSAQNLHPAFGLLNFQEWIILHGKHVRHHLRQFGLL
jgi:oxepin-CoA hydrolase/3-oxo-5,6-dehydrosuberyl-CoA semialdehyde dehydrogenase